MMDQHEPVSTRGKGFHCDLCKVKIATEKAVEDHLQGKKHQRLTAIQTSRQKQAECSVYVGGLTKLVSDLEVTDHFTKFGAVAQVIVDKDKGKYAIVEFSDKDSAEKASEEEKQKMNGKKITVRPREVKPFTPKTKQHTSPGKQVKTAKEKELDAVLEKLLDLENVSNQMTDLLEETSLNQSDLQLRYLICDLLQEVLVEMFPKSRVFPYGSSVSGLGVKGCDLDLQIDLGRDAEQFKYQFASMPMGEEVDMDDMEQELASADQPGTSVETPDISQMSQEEILGVLCRLIKQCVPSCQHVRVIPSSRRPVIKFIHKESGLHCDLSLDNRLALRNTELLNFYCSVDHRVRPLVFAVRHWAKHHQLAGNQGSGPRLTNYALTMLVIHYLQNTQPQLLPTVHQLKELADSPEPVCLDGWNCSFTTDTSKVNCSNTDDIEMLLKGFFSFYTKCDFTTNVICPASGSTVPLTQFLQCPPQTSSPASAKDFKVGPINIQDPLELAHNVAMNVNDKIAGRLREELRKADLTCISLRYRKQQADAETGRVPRWGLLSLLEDRRSGKGMSDGDGGKKAMTVVIPLKITHEMQDFVKRYSNEEEMKQEWCRQVESFATLLIGDILGFDCTTEVAGSQEGMDAATTSHQEEGDSAHLSRCVENPESDGGGGGDTRGDSGIVGDDDEDVMDEPAPKRQRVDSSSDDLHDVSMASSGDTSLTSPRDLKSPMSVSSPTEADAGGSSNRRVVCKATHAVWVGRRKLRRKLQLEKPWGETPIDELTKERLITEELIKTTAPLAEGTIDFTVDFKRRLTPSTAMVLSLHSENNETSVKGFAHFLDEFVPKMLNHLRL